MKQISVIYKAAPLTIAIFAMLFASCSSGGSSAQNADADDETGTESDAENEETEAPAAFTISADSHCISVAQTASPSELRAAEELKTILSEILSVQVASCAQSGENRGKIIVGRGAEAKALGADPADEELGEQGCLLRTSPPHLIIAGTAGAGTMYGVYDFLKKFAGVRWYAPGASRIPKLSEIKVPEMDKILKPAFLWRTAYYAWPGAEDDFFAHLADNSGGKTADDPYGLEYSFDGIAHSYFSFVSPDEFFDSHPEYFSEIGGIRVREDTQLCLTNPDVLDIVEKRMLEHMASMPKARQHNFSQMDHYNYCECDKCRAINEQYGTTGGTQFWFVNELAKRTSKIYPDKLIGTLAYMYTEEPPKDITMHPNVAVWLCHMYPSCDSHPIDSCPLNADYKRRAIAWSQITSHLYVWHYIVNFTHYYMPFPNFDAMAADMRFYRNIGVEGIFLQGMGHSGGGGEWSLLRGYYGLNLLFDPDADAKALRRDFLDGYYGAAAAPLENYIEMFQSKVKDENIHMHLYTNPAQGYITDELLAKADEFFNEAEAAAQDDAELLDRVKVARMPLYYSRIFPYNGYDFKDGRIHWLSEILSWADLQDFFDRMKAHGFTTTREAAGDIASMEQLYMLIAGNPRVYAIENDDLKVEIVPNLGARMLRVIHKATGECVTAWNVKQGLFFPFNGGLEDRVGGSTVPFGWVEPGVIKYQTESSFATLQNTINGYSVFREIALDGDKPIIIIRTTVSNPSSKPIDCRLREHVEYDLGNLLSTKIFFKSKSGASVNVDMNKVIAGMREGIHYYDQNAPKGEWTLSGSKGLQVVEKFDDSLVDFAWVYSYPDTLNEVETEIWINNKTLAPGESVIFERSFEITQTPSASY